MRRLGYILPSVDDESPGSGLPPQGFYDSAQAIYLGQDFENWLIKTGATLGLNFQPGSDARTSAANFYAAFELKLQEQQAMQAAQATPASTDISQPAPVAPALAPPPNTQIVMPPQTVYTSTAVTPSASGGDTMNFTPQSVSESQLTANALAPAPAGINWGVIGTILALLVTASGKG